MVYDFRNSEDPLYETLKWYWVLQQKVYADPGKGPRPLKPGQHRVELS